VQKAKADECTAVVPEFHVQDPRLENAMQDFKNVLNERPKPRDDRSTLSSHFAPDILYNPALSNRSKTTMERNEARQERPHFVSAQERVVSRCRYNWFDLQACPHLAKEQTTRFESSDDRREQPPVEMVEQHDQVELFTPKVLVGYIATAELEV
jgi:hypothetical protein